MTGDHLTDDEYYRLLGLDPGAGLDEIRAAYRREAKRWHPDHAGGDAKRMQAVNEALRYLTDSLRTASGSADTAGDEPARLWLTPSEVRWHVDPTNEPEPVVVRLSSHGGPIATVNVLPVSGSFWELQDVSAGTGEDLATFRFAPVDVEALAPGVHTETTEFTVDDQVLTLTLSLFNARPANAWPPPSSGPDGWAAGGSGGGASGGGWTAGGAGGGVPRSSGPTVATPAFAGRASGPRAGFWRRLAAALIDSMIFWAITIPLSAAHLDVAIGLPATIAYYALLEGGPRGQTVGKLALGIRVIDLARGGQIGYGRGLIRWLGRLVSAFVFAIGYLWMLWDGEKQTWHDKMAGSVVVPVEHYPLA